MRALTTRVAASVLLVILGGVCIAAPPNANVSRATLRNGLRVVIVRDAFAPVVSVYTNYLVGATEGTKAHPIIAHAVEYMMFGGSPGLSGRQEATLEGDLGDTYNGVTRMGVTRFEFTVPASDLDVALHISSIRMRGADMAEAQWEKVRGAADQEIARDRSRPQ